MSNNELELQRLYEQQQSVVLLYTKGFNFNEIQKQTGLRRKEIERHLETFRDYAKQDKAIRERSKEIVLMVDAHYSHIINGMHGNVEQANLDGDYKASLGGYKMIADVEAKRVELLSKAGMLADSALGDQIAENEEKQKILIDILKDISEKYPKIGKEIADRLTQVTNTIQPVRVVADNV